MTLEKYLKQNELKDGDLAVRVGVSQPCIYRLRKGYRRASPELAKKLEKVTGIPAETFVFAKVKPEPKRKDRAVGAAA